MTAAEIVVCLRSMANPENLKGMARYGIATADALGVPMPKLRSLAKEIGHDHDLAAELWATGIHEARILATLVDRPAWVTQAQMSRWAKDFDSWDVCDQACMNLFRYAPDAWKMARSWATAKPEFVRRAAFSLMASLAVKDKRATDADFESLLSLIAAAATDPRNMVKKAVNWALRGIGKRNSALRLAAIATAGQIRLMDSPAARWIASDALRELRNFKPRVRKST
jgi:3-methyladenine DNA glycosylase AlkD